MLQNNLISFFALFKVAAFLIASVAVFQILAESLLKLSLAATDLASSFHCFMELGLITLSYLTISSKKSYSQ